MTVPPRIRLLAALRPAGALMLLLLTLVFLVSALLPAAYAVALGLLVDGLQRATATHDHAALTVPLVVFAAVLVTAELAATSMTALMILTGGRIDSAQRKSVTDLVVRADVLLLERPAVRVLIRDALADRAKGYDSTLADGALALLRSAASVVGVAAACLVLVRLSWWLPFVVLIPAVITRILRTRQDISLMQAWRSATGNELAVDVWRNANLSAAEGKDIRIYGLRDWMIARMRASIRDSNVKLWGHIDRNIRRLWWQAVLVLAGLVPVYVLTASAAVDRRVTVAVASAIFTAAWAVYQVLSAQTNSYLIAGGTRALTAATELKEVLGASAARVRATAASGSPQGGQPPLVRFEDVHFSYPQSERPVLQGIDLEIRPGELLALVGLNGAGKTTLMTLLSGVLRPSSGQITIDGISLADVDLADWWSRMSIVFQDFIRYPMTAAQNVALGSGDVAPDQARLDDAAVKSGLADLIRELPAGWETPLRPIRTGGVDLSGGQWQHVVLARALYALSGTARLLVLDEPAAHLDVAAEFAMFERIAEWRGRACVVLISHRLSTVRRADRIAVLDGGRISEVGSHDELMDAGGLYAELFTAQARRFVATSAARSPEPEPEPEPSATVAGENR